MRSIALTLPSWIYRSIIKSEIVLTHDREYFLLVVPAVARPKLDRLGRATIGSPKPAERARLGGKYFGAHRQSES